MNSRWIRNGLVWLLIFVAGGLLLFNFTFRPTTRQEVSLNKLAGYNKNGEVKKLTVQGDEITISKKAGGPEETSRKESRVSAVEALTSLGVTQDQLKSVEIEVQNPSDWGNVIAILGSFLPLVIVGAFL